VTRGYDSVRFRIAARKLLSWKKTARETDREYLSVKLDHPGFAATIWPLWPWVTATTKINVARLSAASVGGLVHFECRLLADTVEKVENQRAPKISRKSNVGDLNRCRLCRTDTSVSGRFCVNRCGPSHRSA
jgi:hypothetical protein